MLRTAAVATNVIYCCTYCSGLSSYTWSCGSYQEMFVDKILNYLELVVMLLLTLLRWKHDSIDLNYLEDFH